ncbi:GIY-YIG nuclease family protein [Roseococcus pinisoli]|uniref:GIY-YIG nuclease family protein n=1 Tax=Roseococcus pinisoli TaxID=2835040 RepID=A0ABS5QBZ5_9PROT|nr:GIY-YIG nuclease family protein [Roseococcus pinisoli]MBS7810776.1 GIY-YIG nuclease family protein [Roseococcus pinisoli]
MQQDDRKAAIAAYKERRVATGVYAVRSASTGRQWVGSAPDLATIWNRLSFTLRQGHAPQRSLQAAWREHGAEDFTFAVVEQVDVEKIGYGRDRALRSRVEHWCEALHAEPL